MFAHYRIFFILLLGICALGAPTTPKSDSNPEINADKDSLIKIFESIQDAANKGDFETVKNLTAQVKPKSGFLPHSKIVRLDSLVKQINRAADHKKKQRIKTLTETSKSLVMSKSSAKTSTNRALEDMEGGSEPFETEEEGKEGKTEEEEEEKEEAKYRRRRSEFTTAKDCKNHGFVWSHGECQEVFGKRNEKVSPKQILESALAESKHVKDSEMSKVIERALETTNDQPMAPEKATAVALDQLANAANKAGATQIAADAQKEKLRLENSHRKRRKTETLKPKISNQFLESDSEDFKSECQELGICSKGWYWSITECGCVKKFQKFFPESKSEVEKNCRPSKDCPKGWKWSSQFCRCLPNRFLFGGPPDPTFFYRNPEEIPNCSDSEFLDPSTLLCVSLSEVQKPENGLQGQEDSTNRQFDFEFGKERKHRFCPERKFWSRKYERCICRHRYRCEFGWFWSNDKCRCFPKRFRNEYSNSNSEFPETDSSEPDA